MSGLVRVSEAVNLGLHSALLLAQTPDRLVRTQELSERIGASKAHLTKVLQALSKAHIVDLCRGPQGGARLARAASSITLLEVYESIDGPIRLEDCLLEQPICDGTCCLMGGLLARVNRDLRQRLADTTLAEACGGSAALGTGTGTDNTAA